VEVLVHVFLGIIALSAVLQAVFVAVLALGIRKLGDDVDAYAAQWDEKILPITRAYLRVTDTLVSASGAAVDQARRAELRLSELADRVGRSMERAAGGMESTVVDAADRLEDEMMPGLARKGGPLGRMRALWKGFREAAAVYSGD
jgi:hypothetical protein